MKLSELIIEYRKKNNLSQRKFASMCGFSNAYLSMLENEINPTTNKPLKPTVQVLAGIAKAMNITITELFETIEDMPITINSKTAPAKADAVPAELIELLRQLPDEAYPELLQFAQYLRSKYPK